MPRLLDRVVQLRRRRGPERQATPEEAQGEDEQRLGRLEQRLDRLETVLEGLQDSVHRQAVRHERELDEVARKVQPAEIARTLARHNREHGL